MEAVPRMPMLSFELKISPVCPDFGEPFKRIINKYYGEDGDSYDRQIIELETLRNSACLPVRTVVGCSTLKRYYAQIYSLYTRFIAFEKNINVQCVWADVYTGQSNVGDLDYELACILYNIGALHSDLGASDSRQTAEAMKVACTHFQCAAWAFQKLADDKRLYRTPDLMSDLLNFYAQVMLAQAQECFLEKSMLDNRRANIVAKVVIQLVEFYQSAMRMLQAGAMNTTSANSIPEVVGGKYFKSWKKFIDFKYVYYEAIARLYMGNVAEDLQKMGDRVSWYEAAKLAIGEAERVGKTLDSCYNVSEAITFVSDIITVKVDNAKKENDFIYHEKVIPFDQLKKEEGASLVKGVPFDICDPEVSGPDLFARLVPIEAHETASIYSAQKDDILRRMQMMIEEKDQELASFLSALQLDPESLRTPKEEAVPDELIDICAELSLQPDVIEYVEELLDQLNRACKETDTIIKESKELLQAEEAKETEHQERWGKRPPSIILVELSKELAKHEQTHQKAIESNRSLWENFDQHKDDIRVLTSSSAAKIASVLPSTRQVKMDENVIGNMEKLFDKINEMRRQREQLLSQMVKTMDEDNILKKVLVHSRAEMEDIFKQELHKYDKTTQLLEMNLAAQENILKALTDHNAYYAETRREIIELQRNRKTRIASLLYTHQVFKELQSNSRKGVDFYAKFQPLVVRLNARIRGVSKVQDEERSHWVNAQTRNIAPGGAGPLQVAALNRDGATPSPPVSSMPMIYPGQQPPSQPTMTAAQALPSTLSQTPSVSQLCANPVVSQFSPNPSMAPVSAIPVVPSNQATAPLPRNGPLKLKDYLPYMSNNRAAVASSTSISYPPPPAPTMAQPSYPQSQQQPPPQPQPAPGPNQPNYPQNLHHQQPPPHPVHGTNQPGYPLNNRQPQQQQVQPTIGLNQPNYQQSYHPQPQQQPQLGANISQPSFQQNQHPQQQPQLAANISQPSFQQNQHPQQQHPITTTSASQPNQFQPQQPTYPQYCPQPVVSAGGNNPYQQPPTTYSQQQYYPQQYAGAGGNSAGVAYPVQQQQPQQPHQPQQQQSQQPNQQYASQQQPTYYPQQQYYQHGHASYPQQSTQQQQQQPVSVTNPNMSIYQKLEIESQIGWTPLTPVKANGGSTATVDNGNMPVAENGSKSTTTSADVLPDILSTMSIGQQQQPQDNTETPTKAAMANGTNGSTNAGNISSSTASQGSSTNQNNVEGSDKPKSLLSEFDPLFT